MSIFDQAPTIASDAFVAPCAAVIGAVNVQPKVCSSQSHIDTYKNVKCFKFWVVY